MAHRLTALALLALLAFPVAAAFADHGVFTGRVVNGTEGAAVPAGLSVTATVGDTQASTVVGADGSFTFDLGHPDGPVALTVEHQGAPFTAFRTEGATETVLTIYEVTEDDAQLQVSSDTITIVAGDEGTLEVLQIMRVLNPTQRAVYDSEGALRMPLLPAAFDISLGEGMAGDPAPIPGGLAFAGPILPGESPVGYVYKVRVPRSGLSMDRDVFYPTDRVDLLLGEGLELSASSGFSFEEEVTLAGKAYRRYRHSSPTPGAPLRASITFSAGAGLSTATWLVPTLVLIAVIALALPRLRGRSRRSSTRVTESQRRDLMLKIARLDLMFESGYVEQAEYERQRAQLKRQLEDITAELASR